MPPTGGIGIGEHLTCLESQEVGIARTCADEGDSARAPCARLRDGDRQVCGVIGSAASQKSAHVGVDDPAIDARLFSDWHTPLAKLPAHVPDQPHERSPLAPEPAVDASTKRRREVRALARCGDRDQQWIAADDRRRDETALRRTVDNVDEDAGRLGLFPAAPVDFGVFAGIDFAS